MSHEAESEIDPASHDDSPTATPGDDAFWQSKAANAIDDNWLQMLEVDQAAAAPVTTRDLTSPSSAIEFQSPPTSQIAAPLDADAWFTSLSDDMLPDR